MDLPVTSLSGIGPVYGGRLNKAGYRTVRDIYNKFNSLNFDKNKCESWLYDVCDANSRYCAMCYEDVRSMRGSSYDSSYSPFKQKNQSYRSESPTYCEPQRLYSPLYTPQQSPQRSLFTPVQQSSPSISGPGISKAEVMQMMAELKNKQDAMTTQINKLEQEKSKSDQYIKTLESKITIIEKQSVELQKRHNTKIAELTKKLQDMDSVEQYKNISSSIYLLSQKFDDMITELNELKQRTKIHSYVQALERKIELVKINTSNLRKQQDDKFVEVINKMNDTKSFDQHKEVSKNIISLTEKLDEMIKQQNDYKSQTLTSQRVDAKFKQIKEDLLILSIKLRNETKDITEKKSELTKSQIKPTDIENVQKNIAIPKNGAVAQAEIAKLPIMVSKDTIGSKIAEKV